MYIIRPGRLLLAAMIFGVVLIGGTGCLGTASSVDPGPTASPKQTRRSVGKTPKPGTSPVPKPAPSRPKIAPTGPVIPVSQIQASGRGPGGSLRATGTAAVALTFDDGPDPVNTPRLLDLLKRNGVKATFCVIGFKVRDYPAVVRRIVSEGHTLCNHSYWHQMDLGMQPSDVIRQQLLDTNKAIRAAAPKARIKYFRAPGGNFTAEMVAIASSLGMKSIYWTVDTRDWDFAQFGHGTNMVNHISYEVRRFTVPGAIVLSHDYHKPDTITAYSTLLPWLTSRYKLIALPT